APDLADGVGLLGLLLESAVEEHLPEEVVELLAGESIDPSALPPCRRTRRWMLPRHRFRLGHSLAPRGGRPGTPHGQLHESGNRNLRRCRDVGLEDRPDAPGTPCLDLP